MDRSSVPKESTIRRRKTIQGYHYRRRSKVNFAEQYTAELVHVLGLTLKNNCAFSCDANTGLLAYPAGCVIVLHNPRNNKQSFISNPGQKTITCLKFTKDGNFIATGESGHQPSVRVFSVADRTQIASFSNHIYGISCVLFSPNSKYVISIGYQHDNVINVWDWKKNVLAASNKVSTKVKSVAFSDDSNYFVTVGNRHVKFWYLEKASTPDNFTVPLKGRSAILETLRNHMFCDVVCGLGSESELTFAITRSGLLCQFNVKRTVARHVEIKSGSGRTVCIINDTILCGSGDGSIYIFTCASLEYITEVLPPNVVRGQEIIATAIDIHNMWLHTVYTDHSLIISDVVDFTQPHIHSCSRFHNSCVWDVKVVPDENNSLPPGSFLTCSNDGTLRAWTVEDDHHNLLKIINLEARDGCAVETDGSSKVEGRSICIRSDGKHVAVGDRSGNIHVYNLETFERLAFIPTHEGDVLCMDYSSSSDMLASASRDRCVHTFDDNYTPTHTIADHSAAVTAVKFAQHANEFRVVTCGSDKSLYFCAINSNSGKTEITREQHFVEKHSMGDMAIVDDAVLVACGFNVIEYDIFGGRLKRMFRGSEAGANILRLAIDTQRTLVATSCADKNIYILGFMTGECICVVNGHSEVAVSLTFDNECRLLSTSADSCVFVWSLNHRVADDLRNLQALAGATSQPTTPDSGELDKTAYFANAEQLTVEIIEMEDAPEAASLENQASEDVESVASSATDKASFMDSYLPAWVIKHGQPESSQTINKQAPAMGKWGVRLEQDKVCEEIGNLARTSDLCSTVSSFDDESFAPDIKDELESEGVIFDCDESNNSLGDSERVTSPANPQTLDDVTSENVIIVSYDHNKDAAQLSTEDNAVSQAETETAQQKENVNDDSSEKNLVESLLAVLSDNADIIEKNLRTLNESAPSNDLNQCELNNEPVETGSDQIPESASVEQDAKLASEDNTSPTKEADTDVQSELVSSDAKNILNEGYDAKKTVDELKPVEAESIDAEKSVVVSETTSEQQLIDLCAETSSADPVEPHDSAPSGEVEVVPLKELPAVSDDTQVPCNGGSGLISNSVDLDEKVLVHSATVDCNGVDEYVDLRKLVHVGNEPVHTIENRSSDFVARTVPELQLDLEERKVFISTTKLVITPRKTLDTEETSSDDRDVIAVSDELIENVISRAEAEASENEAVKAETAGTGASVDPGPLSPHEAQPTQALEQDDVVADKTTTNREDEPVDNDLHRDDDDDDELSSDRSEQTENRDSRSADSGTPNSSRASPVLTDATCTPRTDKSRPPASTMPPAFAELLASLTKRRPHRLNKSPPKTLPVVTTYDTGERESQSDHDSLNITLTNEPDESGLNNESDTEYAEPLAESSCDHERDTGSRYECEKASEDLMAVFNHAEEIYHKQKFNSVNGNRDAVNKLVHTFLTIHARILDMKIADDVPKKSVSLNDLSASPSVVSLLREYSDRLIGLVESRVDDDKLLSTHSETV